MKKIILKSLASLFLIGMIVSCSNESDNNEDVLMNSDSSASITAARGDVWSTTIGEDRGNGSYLITADREALIRDLENVLALEGHPASLRTLEIVRKTAVNDPNHTGFFLIGGDDQGTSIGVSLERNSFGSFTLTNEKDLSTSTSCTGCTSGCNLRYLTVNGKKVPFCNEGACGDNCTKSESNYL